MFKHAVLGSFVLTLLATTCPLAGADPAYGTGSLQLSSSPAQTAQTQRIAIDDETTLQGRLTAIPKGTTVMVKLDQPLSSYSSQVGEAVSAIVESDVYMDNQIVIPAGAVVQGAISGVDAAKHMGQAGKIAIQ